MEGRRRGSVWILPCQLKRHKLQMGLCVTFVSGVRRAGKSSLIQEMINRVWKKPPHYLRLIKLGSDKTIKPKKEKPQTSCKVASAKLLEYSEQRIFEILPEALAEIHKKDRYGSVVVEADADPNLRHAYPYDHRIFVMPVPERIEEVFRDPSCAADELKRVLEDTASFASEIFGLFHHSSEENDPSEERSPMSMTHMRGFLYSPLGDELATRIQLQAAYHGLVESDIIVVNDKVGVAGAETKECLKRLNELLTRLRGAGNTEVFRCDPCDHHDEAGGKLFVALEPFCAGGK